MTPSPDEIECLVAIAKRLATQHKMVEKYGRRLIENGFLSVNHGWPMLSRLGVDTLNALSVEVIDAATDATLPKRRTRERHAPGK